MVPMNHGMRTVHGSIGDETSGHDTPAATLLVRVIQMGEEVGVISIIALLKDVISTTAPV